MTATDDSPYSRFINPEVRLRLLHAAVDQAGEAVIVLEDEPADVGRRVVYVNRAFTRMTGYASDEIVGQTLYVLKGPETNQDALNRIAVAFEQGEAIEEEILNYRKDGSTFWVDCSIAPVEGPLEDGRFWVSILRDVTSRKEAETKLRKSESRFRLLAENMRDLVSLHSPEGVCEWVSPSVEQMLGYTIEEYLDIEPYDLIHPEDRERVRAEGHAPVFDGAPDTRVTYRVEHKDGSYVWVESLVRPVRDDDGTVSRLQIVTRDATERKRFEDQLIHAKEKAEEMSQLKSAFLANMSHEVRTPLTNVIGFANVLADVVTDEQQRFVQLIHDGSQRLLRTLNSVLDFAQLESQSINLRVTDIDLHQLVAETARHFHPEAIQRDIDLNVAVEAPAGEEETKEALHIQGDRGALERVFSNLLSNALKFTEEGRIRVCLQPGDDAVTVTVQDTGVGIDADFLPNVFEPFKQESTGFGRSFEGSGLGLSITHHLVDLHGGTITVDSRKGKGTTFTVVLPR
jgi:PAS domain S-box-containing protein